MTAGLEAEQAPTDTATRRAPAARLVAMAVALLVPAAVLLGLATARIGADLAAADRLDRAAGALRAVGGLVVATASGDGTDPGELSAAVTALAGSAEAFAEPPGVAAAWADLRDRAGTPSTDAGQLELLAALAVELGAGVTDSARVPGEDPATAALLRVAGAGLPALTAESARYVRAVRDVEVDPEDPVAIGRQAAIRLQLAGLAADVDTALAVAVDTVGVAVDAALLARAGDHRAALAAFVPPAAFASAAAPTDDVARARAQQQELLRTAAELQRAALVEVSLRTADRRAALVGEQVVAALAAVAALTVAGWVLWTGLGRRPEPVVEPPRPPGPRGGDVVMLDARSLLDGDVEEFERVGRAVRPRGRTARDPA